MKLQGNKLKIVYKSAKNAQNPQKWTISVIHLLVINLIIWLDPAIMERIRRTDNDESGIT